MFATALALAVTLETQLIAQIQARLDAITSGERAVWARDLDPSAILMDEEGHVSTKAQFLAGLNPLPKGSTGSLRVTRPRFTRDDDVAVIAFIADEHETIYGQHFQAQFGMVDTYHRVGGRWLLLSDTSAGAKDRRRYRCARSRMSLMPSFARAAPERCSLLPIAADELSNSSTVGITIAT